MENARLGPKGCPRVAGHLTFTTWSNTAFEAIRNAQGNPKAQTLRFGKETADQAIQQGNAREIAGDRVNGRTYSEVYNTKANSTSPSTIAGDQPSLPKHYSGQYIIERTWRTPTTNTASGTHSNNHLPSQQEAITKGKCMPKEDTNCRNQQTDPGRLAILPGNPGLDSVIQVPKSTGIHGAAMKNPAQTAGIHSALEICLPKLLEIHSAVEICPPKLLESIVQLDFP
ncbi:hypothetical protein R3P38DRAFT_2784818 [Favolaschia claudopus]|uniref:Uncharacterized protein n=1 Tax=Favolaschia claudopus TaxID=2862362 RepID=A0AAW0AUB8_9AGAR